MTGGLDALVVGGGVAAAAAAAGLAASGRRVGLIRPRASPSPPSGLVSGRALARAPPWARTLPMARSLSGRTVLLLDRESSVSLEYRDASWAASGLRDGLASGTAWVETMASSLRSHGGDLIESDEAPRIDRDASGRVRGVPGHAAPLTLVEEPLGAAAASLRSPWWTLRRSYPLPREAVSSRLAVVDGEGAFWECVLGFLDPPTRGAGFLYPSDGSLSVGVTVSTDRAEPPSALARSALDALVAHPAIAPVLAGSTPSEEVLAPAGVGRSVGSPAAGPGFLSLGLPLGGGFATVAGAPSLDRELARGVAAASAIARALADGSDGTGALAGYRTLLASIERSVARSSLGLALNPRAAAGYPGLSALLLHELMHESGRPKEPVAAAVQRVRRTSRRSWLRLTADALELARSL